MLESEIGFFFRYSTVDIFHEGCNTSEGRERRRGGRHILSWEKSQFQLLGRKYVGECLYFENKNSTDSGITISVTRRKQGGKSHTDIVNMNGAHSRAYINLSKKRGSFPTTDRWYNIQTSRHTNQTYNCINCTFNLCEFDLWNWITLHIIWFIVHIYNIFFTMYKI